MSRFTVVHEALLVFLQVVSAEDGEGACDGEGIDGGGSACVSGEQVIEAVAF